MYLLAAVGYGYEKYGAEARDGTELGDVATTLWHHPWGKRLTRLSAYVKRLVVLGLFTSCFHYCSKGIFS